LTYRSVNSDLRNLVVLAFRALTREISNSGATRQSTLRVWGSMAAVALANQVGNLQKEYRNKNYNIINY
jgi:hypothetical protein